MTRPYRVTDAALAQRKAAGAVSSRKKTRAVRRNGKLGGRPRKAKP